MVVNADRLYSITVDRRAARQLEKLPDDVYAILKSAIDGLALNPRPPGCKKLQGRGDQWRLRRGDYRIIYEIEDAVLRVLVVEVGHRGGVYA